MSPFILPLFICICVFEYHHQMIMEPFSKMNKIHVHQKISFTIQFCVFAQYFRHMHTYVSHYFSTFAQIFFCAILIIHLHLTIKHIKSVLYDLK